jgi:Leucine-rich repeat (LRR) protein
MPSQEITRIDNLNLPYLRELYLHRNLISSMDGLQNCPKLKKLWLCQNQISTIGNLTCFPELEELWLQTNLISSLHGMEGCQSLTHFNISGNLISDFAEIRRLSSLPRLTKLSFQDIHFGRCPVTDSEGYKEFILCHLKQV